jgi:hypothetical protein
MRRLDGYEESGQVAKERVGIRLQLAALWTALMCFYAYADLLGFFDPKLMAQILTGKMGSVFGPVGTILGVDIGATIGDKRNPDR